MIIGFQTDPGSAGSASTIYSPFDYHSFSSTPATMASTPYSEAAPRLADIVPPTEFLGQQFPIMKAPATTLAGALGHPFDKE